jgi:hypothetical protein
MVDNSKRIQFQFNGKAVEYTANTLEKVWNDGVFNRYTAYSNSHEELRHTPNDRILYFVFSEGFEDLESVYQMEQDYWYFNELV